MRLAVYRFRPSIGDVLLLSPTIEALRERFKPSSVTAITISDYMSGAMLDAFRGLPGIDRVEGYDTEECNPALLREMALRFHKCFDCTDAFLQYELAHNNKEHLGIAEFWVRHFDVHRPGLSLLPKYLVSATAHVNVLAWLKDKKVDTNKPLLGIVLRAANEARNWDRNDLVRGVVDWAHTSGYVPIVIDPIYAYTSPYAVPFVGQRLPEVAALLKQCRVVLTPDTGLLHLAQAVGTKTVAMFGVVAPQYRVVDYNTIVLPRKPIGRCNDSSCPTCRWPEAWSCMGAQRLNEIVAAVTEAMRVKTA